MLDDDERAKVVARLKRIEGQVAAVRRMIESERYCVDVLLQVAAARGALDRVGRIVLESHVQTCVQSAMESGTEEERTEKLRELLQVFDRYGR